MKARLDMKKTMGSYLSKIEREFTDMVDRIRRLEAIPVPDAAKLMSTTPRWIRNNLPIIHHGQRGQRIRLVDIEEFQTRRTVRNGDSKSIRKVSENVDLTPL